MGKAACAKLARPLHTTAHRRSAAPAHPPIFPSRRGAARFGGLAAFFWALALGAGVYRGERRPVADVAMAAAATGGLFGALGARLGGGKGGREGG